MVDRARLHKVDSPARAAQQVTMFAAIPFPDISPEVFSFDLGSFHFAVRWYALAYIAGIVIAWAIIARALSTPRLWDGEPPMTRVQLEAMVTWMVIGIIVGGRLGYVLFYQPGYYLSNPFEILQVWTGGMAFHGGFLGVLTATWLFCRKHGLRLIRVFDLLALSTAPAFALVRITNFINAELWGRPTTQPWGVIFPGEAAQTCPGFAMPCARHPSQLYEALLEGVVLASILLYLGWRRGWLKRPGWLTGVFAIGYGLARFAVEFFRQADGQFVTVDNPFGHVLLGMTMGQILSLPMIVAGAAVLVWARRQA
jgi:phosphatidylglycerol:prolipoprotein diacylglycerol transferase